MSHRKLKYCTNCEVELDQTENFCPSCGQKNLDRKVHFWVFIGDFIRDEFNLDNRFFRSFKQLILKPGFLTVAFMEGKRRSYLRPSQMFLIAGFLCFFVLSFQLEQEVTELSKEKGNMIQTDLFDSWKKDTANKNVFIAYAQSHIAEANENPANFVSNTLQKLPFVLLIVLPFFALFHKLLYIRHRIYFVEHLVFLLHAHTLLFLLIFVGGILMIFMAPNILWYIIPTMFLYLFIAFRNVYKQRLTKTFLKFSVLFWVYILLVPVLWMALGALIGVMS